MKALNILLIVGGILQVLCLVLHVAVFFSIAKSPTLGASDRQDAYLFNTAVTVTLLFFVYVSLLRRQELLGASLGRSVCIFIALFYVLHGVVSVVLRGPDLRTLGFTLVVVAPYAIVAAMPR